MDFAQPGPICTLQQLNPAHAPRLEAELEEAARDRPISLVLPCHGSELAEPAALQHLCAELAGARWLREVIVGVNGVTAAGFAKASAFFTRWLPLPARVIWSDGPQLSQALAELAPHRVPTGKALNVWVALGFICAEARSEIIVTQDCDVRSFRRETLARLCHACAHPGLDFAFAKLFYARATDRLYGRVSRLFLAPLLRAARGLGGGEGLVEFLLAFRYPLAGECAMRRDLAAQLRLHDGWGLETGMLCEVFRHTPPERVCQVEGGEGYDHRHHSAKGGVLEEMAAQVAGALLAYLRRESKARRTDAPMGELVRRFRVEAAAALRRSAALALINGLPFDEAGEHALAERFAQQLEALLLRKVSAQRMTNSTTNWAEILCSEPVRERFLDAVAADQRG